ncbi:TPR repeat-containing thioredoxin TTL1 [Mercurialis annua]|uniref:TPR repeat-containing thioredoxin TTL1 n=1 Tax=Mercurialis annua TaxID=3986 RepID=UPI00215F860E|nr:TPR repeat-containing thioredoxin TTL1 [Mercurialis annua]
MGGGDHHDQLGCGLMGGIFPRRSFWQRKSSVYSLPTESGNKCLKALDSSKEQPICKTKSEAAILDTVKLPEIGQKHTRRHSLAVPSITSYQKNNNGRISVDSAAAAARCSSSSSSSSQFKAPQNNETKPKRISTSDSRELSVILATNTHQSRDSKALIRANSTPSTVTTHKKLSCNGVMGNIVRQSSGEFRHCQTPTSKMDPEILKNMGNEKYKKGKFEEALAFYDRAISLDSSKAAYRSNRSAALIGLGRTMEAVSECKEAIRLNPAYHRAHHRLATLYVRLGEAEKALYHYKQSGIYADSEDISQAQALRKHLNRCIEARKLQDWNILLKETDRAISSGGDASPQVYAMQAEALLRLHKHEEAYRAYRRGPSFSVESFTKCFGLPVATYLFTVGAQVYMAAGRFEDAMAAAQQAACLDPSNREINKVVKTARAVASARLTGNLLYKAEKFSEACISYSEGLEYEPFNSILLCNRAACLSKLYQFEKAIEDCTEALRLQPNYSKARLRRAHCNAKIERWEASIEDYEMLIKESPADEELGRALFDAKIQLKKQHGEDIKEMKFGSNLVFISSNERFRYFVKSPGMSVVLFCNKEKHEQVLQLMQQVCKIFPSVYFLKVEVEDHPCLEKSESVTSLPSFKIYKNGSRVKEIPGNNRHLLEKSVKLYSS